MLNKENYVPWSSLLLHYAQSRPNGKLIYNSIMNGLYVKRMIPEPGDTDRDVPINEIFHEQTHDELTENELKQVEADDQAIQTILLIDYTQLYDFLKYNQKEVDDLKGERFAKTHDPLALIENSNNPFNYSVFHPDQPSLSTCMQQPLPNNNYNPQPSINKNYMQQPMPNLKDITDPTTAMDMALVLMAKAFKLNYSTPTNNNQRISSNPNGNGKVIAAWAEGNAIGNNGNQIRCYNCRGLGHLSKNCTIRPRRRDAAYLQTWLLIAQKSLQDSAPTPQESKVMKNDNVIASGMFSINPFKNSKEEKFVPNKPIKASVRTKPITISQHYVLIKKAINSNSHDSVCSKHMTGNLELLINFVSKFLGTIRFGNNHVAAILGYGDLQWGNILIARFYFVEGLGHNLFSVGKFCDSDLEVAFRRNTCFVKNLEGVDLLKGNHTTNLYTINLYEMAYASPICLMAHATSTKSWLWHQRLSHLNFDTINDLSKNDLVTGLPKFKYHKENLCPSCEQGKSKRASHQPKLVLNSKNRLCLLHGDLCGPMRVESINGKRYIMVIVDDYSRYTLVHFLRSKDEAPKIKTSLKKITVLLQAPVIIVRTNNSIEFKNHMLQEYFNSVGISHQASSVHTPQQNGVVERRNCTLVEAARTILIFSHAPLFLWDEAIATTCYTQNRSIIHRQFDKTPYQLINGKKPNISFLHVFGALWYLKNDREDIRKLGAKGDIGFFIAMTFEQSSLKPGLQSMTSRQISSRLDLTYALSIITTQQPAKCELDLLFEATHDDYIGGQPLAAPRTVPAAQKPQVL
nr:retrovirus-related Pol polyprotein from transposon TNT 1-94 [Tanacetum cinerariifolium]